MDKQRIVIAAIGLAIAVVLGLGYLLGIQPQLSAASAAAEQTATALANNQASQVQLAKLKSDYAKISEFDGQLTQLQRSIPSSPSLDTLLSDLRALAASTGTTIAQFTPGQAVAYTPPAAPAAPAPAKGSSASGGSSPTPTPTPSAAAPTAPTAPKVTTNPLINASNFVAIPVTIGVQGSMDGAIAFLGGLQHGSRLVLVTGFSGNEEAVAAAPAPSAKPGTTAATPAGATFTINGFVYVLPSPHPAPASPTPSPASTAAPSPTPTAAPSKTPTPTPTPSR